MWKIRKNLKRKQSTRLKSKLPLIVIYTTRKSRFAAFLDAGACFASKTRLRITGEVCVLNDGYLGVKVIIGNDFIYRYTFLELICTLRKMPSAQALPKGQLISKGLFGILEFSQKTNKRIRFYYYDEFVRSFFGRIRGHQKVLSKLSDL